MKTEIIKIKGDWLEVLNDCRSTVHKKDRDVEPGEEFRRNILVAEHSPIRDISVKWRWTHLKSWIATHFSRHKWECFIRTQRSDRTGIDRDELPQGNEVEFTGEANVQHLIDTSRKRLCYQAADETRHAMEDLKTEIDKREPLIAEVMVPNCVYRCGCPEIYYCGEWGCFTNWLNMEYGPGGYDLTDIKQRYALYAKYRKAKQDAENAGR